MLLADLAVGGAASGWAGDSAGVAALPWRGKRGRKKRNGGILPDFEMSNIHKRFLAFVAILSKAFCRFYQVKMSVLQIKVRESLAISGN